MRLSTIKDGAFSGCEKLENIYITARDISTIGDNVIDNSPLSKSAYITGLENIPVSGVRSKFMSIQQSSPTFIFINGGVKKALTLSKNKYSYVWPE